MTDMHRAASRGYTSDFLLLLEQQSPVDDVKTVGRMDTFGWG